MKAKFLRYEILELIHSLTFYYLNFYERFKLFEKESKCGTFPAYRMIIFFSLCENTLVQKIGNLFFAILHMLHIHKQFLHMYTFCLT